MRKLHKFVFLFLCLAISIAGHSQDRNLQKNKSFDAISITDRQNTPSYIEKKEDLPSFKKTVNSSTAYSHQNRLVYCEPNFSSCSSDHINKVIFAGINNDSECGTGHNDYTDQVGLVVTGETYTISVRNQALSSQNVFAYIDWNQNGILNDAGEVYTIANNAHHSGPHTQEIAIPQDAVLGETRMRVVLQWNNTNANPCIVYGTGESEDYTLNVVDEIPNLPLDCTQLVPSLYPFTGGFFIGDRNQRLAVDIDVLPESTFALNTVKIQTLGQASTFDLVFHDNVDGLPGTPDITLNNVNIVNEEFLGSGQDYEYYIYTLDVSSNNILFEGDQDGIKVWMEVISDAIGWNNTNSTTLGSFAAYSHDDSDGWNFTDREFVYELIGICTGSQIQDLPNNACSNAIPINCGDLVTGTTVGADDFGGNLSPDVFYSYTGSGQAENISISLCVGTEYDTLIRVFSDCSLANEITFNDNFCYARSVVNFVSDGVSTYYIMIEGSYASEFGDFTLYASCQTIPPQNETPAHAVALECGDRVQGNNVNASNIAGNPAGDVFYTYTGNGIEEDITVSLCSVFTSYDTEIRVYDDISLSNLVGFADDDCGLFSQVTFYSDGETTYYIMIEGSEIEEGNFDLRVSCWDYTPYCSPLNFVFVEPITNVEIADIAHRSSAEPTSPPHEVFTDIIGNLNQGETYEITLEGFTGADGEWNNFFTVFIDWNQNNVFNDTGEMYEIGSIFDSSGTDGNQLMGSITVPQDAEIGSTVMRVLKAYDTSPIDPCSDYGYGQVEDYTINVLDALGNDDFTLNKITYFPNPTENEINIKSDLPLSKITIYDIAGKVIQVIKPDSNNVQLDLSYLSNGIYLAKVITKQEVQTFKIIKE
ncbi:GEVED domain-containing protein [Aequorivita viscosa]|uniref:Por secretion system C-terminal sorting domain-containing protein n=1 Tax=Aequorivita viscosa TaxID=797419 RepID=A0A1M6PLS9_9FLAO|nr:GEVED domain-containing protein [Aequorivita viscosa]SDX56037.1 Por secretion system C-terminal sorting domain-containing protein [Aequorivita viscosa]SHK08807.1 Por secretion system C-terminal sorting domain-containing protein [Aequorivita viscosa]